MGPPGYTWGHVHVETGQEDDRRRIAEVPELPGMLAYGQPREKAVRQAQALSLHVLAQRPEHDKDPPQSDTAFSIVA